jgi:myosin heavy subunit
MGCPHQISELDNSIHQFGRHNSDGWALSTPGLCEGLPWTEIQLEDRETYAFNMEHMLRSEMDATDDAKYQLQEKDEKIEQLENTIQKLKEKNKSLEAANDKLTGKVEDQEDQIVGFRGQCIYLHQILMKYKPQPNKEEAPPIVKSKELTQRRLKRTPRS